MSLAIRPQHERKLADRDLLYLILDEVRELRKIVHKLKKEEHLMQEQIQQAFDDLNQKVTNIESEEQAAETLLSGLNQQLQAALSSSNNPAEVVSAVQAISDRLNTDAQSLAAAITANTPSAPASSGNTGSTSSSSSSGADTSSGSTSSGDTTGASSSSGGTDNSSGSGASSSTSDSSGSGTADPTA